MTREMSGKDAVAFARDWLDLGAQGRLSAKTVRALLAEVRRLQSERVRLPVIATCGACGWALGAERLRCSLAADEAGDIGRGVDADSAPPSWCPLRGEASR